MNTFTKNELKYIKEAWTIRTKKLTQEDVNRVLAIFEGMSDRKIGDYLSVHYSTIGKWKQGSKKPAGANKIMFKAMLLKLDK